jgi:hypothetical protein
VIGDRWGVTPDEVRRPYPCDEIVPDPVLQAWRGVSVRAEPERIWLWVKQIRLAPYSYDWIDNLGRRSPQRLCGIPDPVPGEPFTVAMGGRRCGRVLTVAPGEQLTGRIMGAVMSYVLVPVGSTTRLLLKVVTPRGRVTAPLLSLGDLVMARRQLLNLAQLAERTAGTDPGRGVPTRPTVMPSSPSTGGRREGHTALAIAQGSERRDDVGYLGAGGPVGLDVDEAQDRSRQANSGP